MATVVKTIGSAPYITKESEHARIALLERDSAYNRRKAFNNAKYMVKGEVAIEYDNTMPSAYAQKRAGIMSLCRAGVDNPHKYDKMRDMIKKELRNNKTGRDVRLPGKNKAKGARMANNDEE